ncbi:MAG TPA: hypothetical protein VMG12_10915 [Polyangiaceae bacterium]|nr:hypothetical protein [Polyangiaceae bacterium]
MVARKISASDLKGGAPLVQNAFLSLRLFPTSRVVVITRTGQAFQTPAEIESCTLDLARVLPHNGRRGLRVVLDMRSAPVRVHPALDPAFERFRKETETGFACSAIVVTTALGKVRADRLASTATFPMRVVGSMEEAIDFINGE